MAAITITLDGVEVSGYPGMTILDLAREAGVHIPTLCHDPHLTPTGACRLCLVEEQRSGALLAACVAPIAPGMVINTRSPRVIERRKTIIKLLLASHPDSCLVCDKGNRCQLRQIAADMGIGWVGFQRIPQWSAIEEVNPFIERDLSKCILCTKCIRADQELVVEGAIDYIQRGFVTKPATLNDMPLEKSECTFCGTCVAMCPTGALMEKERTYTGTTTNTVVTVCPFCGCGCSVCLEVKDNRLVRARPGSESVVNRNTLCVRGSYGYDFVHSPERLRTPLVKVDGNLQPASWEQALERIAAELQRIKEKHGASSLAILGSSKCTNEENYLLQRLARGVLGTNNIDNGSRLYSSASRVGLGQTIGFPGTTSSLDALEQSKVIVVIGADPASSAPAVGYAIKRAVKYKGARLLLVEPRQTKLVPFAHLWLRPRVGTDVALINGWAKVIIDERLFDEESVTSKTDNFAELERSLAAYTPERVAEITGVASEEVRLAARLLAEAKPAAIVYGSGITQHITGTAGVMALANVAMLTGNIERSGAIFALQRENNARGACDMGSLPDFLPGYQRVDDASARQKLDEQWQVRLPTDAGLTALEMMAQAKTGKVKGMLIVGENPVASFPHPSWVRQALSLLEFLAVVDIFPTETAKLATVVLPAASFAEKEGTFTNFEGRVQRVRRAIAPVGDSRPEWEIIRQLADRMGYPMPYSSPQQVMDEIEKVVPFYQPRASPLPGALGRFAPVEYTPTNVSRDGYPLTLLSGSILYHFGSGSRSSRASRLKKFSPRAWVEISKTDANTFGLSDGDKVKVVSSVGEVTTTVSVTEQLPSGMLFMPMSFPESPVNELFDVALDPQAQTPALKSCAVRLERISRNG